MKNDKIHTRIFINEVIWDATIYLANAFSYQFINANPQSHILILCLLKVYVSYMTQYYVAMTN